jgi:hypothetical protein
MLNVENESVMKSTKQEGVDAKATAKRTTSLSPKLISHVTDVKRKDIMLMNVLKRTTRHKQQAHRATVDTKFTRPDTDAKEMVMMAVNDAPNSWNTRPRRPPCVPISGFRDFLPDSGATSHFVNCLTYLKKATPCDLEVTIADGSKVHATHVGETEINFISDSGTPSTLLLASV